MGENVEFPSNGSTAGGYLATPASGGAGPGVIVVQEWWGLNDQIRRVCDRLAAEGFTALAPDLYHGELAGHDEMDKAGELMTKLPIDRAVRDMGGAVEFLTGHEAVRGNGVGTVGFCMGGRLVLLLGQSRPEQVKAVVSYYGVIHDLSEIDASKLSGVAVLGHFGTKDDFMPTDNVHALEQQLSDAGVDVEMFLYDAAHAFANEDDPFNGNYDEEAARQAWVRTLEFLRSKLG